MTEEQEGATSRRSVELRVVSGDVHIGGELWPPVEQPWAAVLMVPGSGPSDRHNDPLQLAPDYLDLVVREIARYADAQG